MNPSVVVVNSAGDFESELLVKVTGDVVARLNVEVDGGYLFANFDGIGFNLFAVLVLFGFGEGSILVYEFDLRAWGDGRDDVLDEG